MSIFRLDGGVLGYLLVFASLFGPRSVIGTSTRAGVSNKRPGGHNQPSAFNLQSGPLDGFEKREGRDQF